MKKIFLSLLFISGFTFAQDVEDLQEGFFYAENSRNFYRVEIAKPFGVYKVDSCGNTNQFIRAEFETGDQGFSKELFKYISAYVDREIYVVNGPFYINLSIDALGKVENIDINPKVKNSEVFLKDLKYAVNRINKQWKPAYCFGQPVASKLRIKLNFITESTDL